MSLIAVAGLLFVYSLLLLDHSESEEDVSSRMVSRGSGGDVVDKARTLRNGRSQAKGERGGSITIPFFSTLPIFQHFNDVPAGSQSQGQREGQNSASPHSINQQDDYYFYARDDDDEGGDEFDENEEGDGDGEGEGEAGEQQQQQQQQQQQEEEGEGGLVAAAAAAIKEKRTSLLDRVILKRLRRGGKSQGSQKPLHAEPPPTPLSGVVSSSISKSLLFSSKLQSALIRGGASADSQASASSSASSSSPSRLLHPATPDPSFEPPAAKQPMTCKVSFEPKCPIYKYVRFWNSRFYPEDCYSSPMRHPLGSAAPVSELKYLVFEPDRGGWNNIRMAAETAMIFAHATGRVLVMPPKTKMYLLDKDAHQEDNESTFSKFFDLSKLAESVTIITMEQFLKDVAAAGMLSAPLPPNATPEKLAGSVAKGSEKLWKYLETACYVREWEPGKIHLGFNLTRDASGNPAFGRIDLKDPRVKLHASHARKLVPYDAQMHHHKAIYFPGDYRNTHRILTHFYSYLYWADHHTEHVYKRLVRDRLHYHDDIFCAAGRVVRMLHEEAAALSKGKFAAPTPDNANPLTLGGDSSRDSTYFAYHIRRGDFQYKHTKLSAEQIWANTKHLLAPFMNRTSLIYIATDEKNKAFFEPFRQGFAEHGFKLVFIGDYIKRAMLTDGHLNQNHIGMVEQVICANAHTFIGTPLSTFSGYITRMRGYYRDGRYARTYYTMPEDMYQLHKKPELVGPFWAREFSVAHRDIDDVLI